MECFRHLKCISDILRTKSASPGAIRKLRQVVKQHHTLFVDLYPNLCKPKLHYLAHIADCIERFKTVLTCFSGESLHRLGKSIMRSAYKKSTDTTLSASLQTMRAAVLDKKAFIEVYLEPTIYTIDDPAARIAILRHVRVNGLVIFASRNIKTSRGSFTNNQCLCFATDSGLVFGHSKMFIEIRMHDGSSMFFAWIDLFLKIAGSDRWAVRCPETMLPVDRLLRSLPFVRYDDDHVVVGLPEYMHGHC